LITVGTINAGATSYRDSGTYQFADGYFNTSLIMNYDVYPLELGVGQYPVTYRFRVVPTGDIPRNAYIVITLPDQIKINDEYTIERNCGGTFRDNLLGFTNKIINCQVNNERNITISDGFKYWPTANFSDPDVDNTYAPPELWFDLP
jgi:hypothetical protein